MLSNVERQALRDERRLLDRVLARRLRATAELDAPLAPDPDVADRHDLSPGMRRFVDVCEAAYFAAGLDPVTRRSAHTGRVTHTPQSWRDAQTDHRRDETVTTPAPDG